MPDRGLIHEIYKEVKQFNTKISTKNKQMNKINPIFKKMGKGSE
jgi:hypothetical protein